MSTWYDRIFKGGLLLLIILTPLVFGTVHPWAFSIMEGGIFLLVIVWMSKLWGVYRHRLTPVTSTQDEGQNQHEATPQALWPGRPVSSLFWPLGFFIGLIGFQLLPFPPLLLEFVSPATYEVYARSFPGWPERAPYAELEQNEGASKTDATLHTPLARHRWRPLSLAPVLTQTDGLKFVAYICLFFCILLYPVEAVTPHGPNEAQAEKRFVRFLLLSVLASGLLVASVGILQQFTWNGKILWFFVPYDWPTAQLGVQPRARGPFINPDHFANYLGLLAPLACVGMFAPGLLVSTAHRKAFRVFCGVTLCLLSVGILLSLSRSVWLATSLSLGGVLLMLVSPPGKQPPLLLKGVGHTIRLAALGGALFMVLLLFFVGPAGRNQVDVRLGQTVTQGAGLEGRIWLWKDVVRMLQDFPLVGVGLGSWPEVFSRYQPPPWTSHFYREAHNDYLELGAETGILGVGLLLWFFCRAGTLVIRGWPRLASHAFPAVIGTLAGLGVMAFHSGVDFSLQIPANAILFTVLLAVTLRITTKIGPTETARSASTTGSTPHRIAPYGPVCVAGTGIAALLLLLMTFGQDHLPYPYRLKQPVSLEQVHDLLAEYPAHAGLHVARCRLLKDQLPLEQRVFELEIARWLDPSNPSVRDLYAAALFRLGREEEALQEISQSVFYAPSPENHRYLDFDLIPWLSKPEQQAVEKGLQQATAGGDAQAFRGLGHFYTALKRFSEKGALYEAAARRHTQGETQAGYLIQAGLAYLEADNDQLGEELFRQATTLIPNEAQPYQYLITRVFAVRGDLDAAKATVVDGIQNGADPFVLSLALAEMAQGIQAYESARKALEYATNLRPSAFEAHLRLGQVYIQEKNFDRAALALQKALQITPSSAIASFSLGLAEEGRYKFFPAKEAYARAMELEPETTAYQDNYDRLRQKIAAEIH